MNTTMIALAAATVMVTGLVLTVVVFNFLIGTLEWAFGKPKLSILKSEKGDDGFAFGFQWSEAKEPAKFDVVKIRLFNPFGSPTQVEVIKNYGPYDSSFFEDINMGPGMSQIFLANGFEKATIQVEVSSSKDGVFHQFSMGAKQFLKLIRDANKTVSQVQKVAADNNSKKVVYGVVPRDTIADTVPGRGPKLKLATNPEFAAELAVASGSAASGTGAGAGAASGEANFNVKKVWIEPGCIVCNACENIAPEVFKVEPATCIVVAGHPLDLGLKIKEAAEACPTEVIKYDRAN